MKKINFLSTLLLLSIISTSLLASCKKDDVADDDNNNNNNTQAPTENTLSANVDGVGWIADVATINGVYVSTAGIISIIINGEKPDGSYFTLSLNLWNDQTGTFNTSVMATSNYVGLTYEDASGESFTAPVNGNAAATGTLKINYWDDNKISGSFSFTGGQSGSAETVTITDGVFSCINVQ